MRTQRRTILAAAIVAVFAATLWGISRPPGRLVADDTVNATVVAVGLRQRGPDKQTGAPVLVTVQLADGGRATLWMPPPGPAKGRSIEVRIRRYDDGSRRIGVAR